MISVSKANSRVNRRSRSDSLASSSVFEFDELRLPKRLLRHWMDCVCICSTHNDFRTWNASARSRQPWGLDTLLSRQPWDPAVCSGNSTEYVVLKQTGAEIGTIQPVLPVAAEARLFLALKQSHQKMTYVRCLGRSITVLSRIGDSAAAVIRHGYARYGSQTSSTFIPEIP